MSGRPDTGETGLGARGPGLCGTVNAKRKLLDHLIEEPDGVLLCMARRDREGADTCGVVDRRVLMAPPHRADRADQLQERENDLDGMPRDLLGIPVGVHGPAPDACGQYQRRAPRNLTASIRARRCRHAVASLLPKYS